MWSAALIVIGALAASALAGALVYLVLKIQAHLVARMQFDYQDNTEFAARMEAARYGLDVARVNPRGIEHRRRRHTTSFVA